MCSLFGQDPKQEISDTIKTIVSENYILPYMLRITHRIKTDIVRYEYSDNSHIPIILKFSNQIYNEAILNIETLANNSDYEKLYNSSGKELNQRIAKIQKTLLTKKFISAKNQYFNDFRSDLWGAQREADNVFHETLSNSSVQWVEIIRTLDLGNAINRIISFYDTNTLPRYREASKIIHDAVITSSGIVSNFPSILNQITKDLCDSTDTNIWNRQYLPWIIFEAQDYTFLKYKSSKEKAEKLVSALQEKELLKIEKQLKKENDFYQRFYTSARFSFLGKLHDVQSTEILSQDALMRLEKYSCEFFNTKLLKHVVNGQRISPETSGWTILTYVNQLMTQAEINIIPMEDVLSFLNLRAPEKEKQEIY